MPIEKTFILSKIERIKENLEKIRTKLELSDDDILCSSDHLAVLERYFQLVVDYAIDINHHYIKKAGMAFRMIFRVHLLPWVRIIFYRKSLL